ERSKPDRTAIAAMDEIGPLALSGTVPLVIAVRRNQTTAPLDRILEGRLFQYGLRARIDQQRKFTGILDPGRPQTPTHQTKMPDPVLGDNPRNRLRRRNIKPWREIRLLSIAKHLAQGRRRRGGYE